MLNFPTMRLINSISWTIVDEFYANEHQAIKILTTHDPKQHEEYKQNGILTDGFQLKDSEVS